MSSFSPKDVSHVCKFNGSNYPFWKFQISMVLRQFDLMEIANGKDKAPAPISSGSPPAVTNAADIKTWRQKDNAACCCIVASLEEQVQRSLLNCKSAAAMWQRLSTQYEQAASENKHYLLQRFLDYPYQQGHSVMDHITEIEAMYNQLNDLGCAVSEIQLITKVICSLPPSFKEAVLLGSMLMTARKLCPCSHNDCWKQRASTSSTIQESRLPTPLSLPGEVKPILVKHQASQERRLSAVTARKMVTQKIAAGKSRKENQEKPHHHQLKPELPKPAANPCGPMTTLSRHFLFYPSPTETSTTGTSIPARHSICRTNDGCSQAFIQSILAAGQ